MGRFFFAVFTLALLTCSAQGIEEWRVHGIEKTIQKIERFRQEAGDAVDDGNPTLGAGGPKAFFDVVNAGLAVRIQFRLSRALKLSAILKMPYFAFFCFCWPMRTLKCKTLAS